MSTTSPAKPKKNKVEVKVQPDYDIEKKGIAVRLEETGLPLNYAGDWTMVVRAATANGSVRSEPWAFTLTFEDGSVPTTAITIPPANTVVVTTAPEG